MEKTFITMLPLSAHGKALTVDVDHNILQSSFQWLNARLTVTQIICRILISNNAESQGQSESQEK